MSPLRWFRKHATWMLIIFGVVLMAIFGLGPVFDNMARGFQSSANAQEDPVIIEYRGGEVTRSRLDELQRNHFATRRFLNELMKQAAKQCETKEVQYGPLADMIRPLARTDNAEVVDEQMLVRKLLAERAEDEGVVISDGMVDDYMTLLCGQAEFSEADWRQINKLVNQRTPLTVIRDHLRLELKYTQMQRFASIGVPFNPVPTEAVELYAHANDRIECEVVPVSVTEYVSKVDGEPSRSEMMALYEEGKYEYEDAGKQQPGFKVPRKVNIQYFVAEMDTFLQNEKAKLTDGQVEAEYEKLVAAEDPIVVEVIPQADPQGFNMDFGDDKPAEASGDAAPAEKSDAMPEKSADGELKLDAEKDVPVLDLPDAKIEEPAIPDPKTLKEMPAVESTDGLKVTPAEEKGGLDQSFNVRSSKNQFASFVQEAEVEVAQEAAVETVAQETVAQEPAVETVAQESTDSEVGGLGGLELSDESAGPQTGENTKKTRIKPLSEVADEIRERLARAAAFRKKEEAKKRADILMDNYRMDVLRWEEGRDKDTTPAPDTPDFEAIAKENGLVFAETGLVDPFELRETKIGKVNFLVQVQSPQGGTRPDYQSVANKIFLDYDRVDVNYPQSISDLMTADAYVFWMSEKVEVRIPEFEESQEKIKEYWKHQQAIELATKAAQGMADKANSSGDKLTTLYPDDASPTGEFTWFRPGRSSQAVYGMPFGIEQPGEEFMESAFSLENGKATIAANESRDTVYVVQRITEASSVVELGDEYLDKQYFRFKRVPTDVMGAAQHYARELDLDWNQEFVKSMNLKRMK